MHNGEKFRLIRNLRGLSQEDLAQKIKKTRSLVSYIEQTGNINYRTFQTLLKALKISENYVENFTAEGVLNSEESKEEYKTLQDQLQEVREKFNVLKDENKLLKDLVESQKNLIAEIGNKKKKRGNS